MNEKATINIPEKQNILSRAIDKLDKLNIPLYQEGEGSPFVAAVLKAGSLEEFRRTYQQGAGWSQMLAPVLVRIIASDNSVLERIKENFKDLNINEKVIEEYFTKEDVSRLGEFGVTIKFSDKIEDEVTRKNFAKGIGDIMYAEVKKYLET